MTKFKTELSLMEISIASIALANKIFADAEKRGTTGSGAFILYPIPRGGVASAFALRYALRSTLAQNGYSTAVEVASISRYSNEIVNGYIVDDLTDSGGTISKYAKKFDVQNMARFAVLFAKPGTVDSGVLYGRSMPDVWIVFPWEHLDNEDTSAHDVVTRMLQRIGEDPMREGLLDTPKRVIKAWGEWFSGYGSDAKDVLKTTFKDGRENYDELVMVSNIPFYSHCEHHMAPIIGHAHVGYLPSADGGIVGLSKLARLVEMFSRRLQVQERMTTQIAYALQENLQPLGVGVVIRARHLCMESRGINRPGTWTTTSAMLGALRNKPEARAEFLSLCDAAERQSA